MLGLRTLLYRKPKCFAFGKYEKQLVTFTDGNDEAEARGHIDVQEANTVFLPQIRGNRTTTGCFSAAGILPGYPMMQEFVAWLLWLRQAHCMSLECSPFAAQEEEMQRRNEHIAV